MADITMCVNTKCPLRSTCLRYTAQPTDEWQSYSYFEPVDNECNAYWACKENPNIKEIDMARKKIREEIENTFTGENTSPEIETENTKEETTNASNTPVLPTTGRERIYPRNKQR